MTSAPRSPSSIVQNGPARTVEQSMTRMPLSGPGEGSIGTAGIVAGAQAAGRVLGREVEAPGIELALPNPFDEVASHHDRPRPLLDDVDAHPGHDPGIREP